MVVGHYGCGGVRAALLDQELGLIDNWLRHVRSIYRRQPERFEGLTQEDKEDLLCELNVLDQTRHVEETSFVQKRMEDGSATRAAQLGLPTLRWFVARSALQTIFQKRLNEELLAAGRESLSDDLYEHPFSATAIELAIEDLLPRTEVESSIRDRHDDLSAHDGAFKVGVRVVFAGVVVAILPVGVFRR